MTAPSRFLFTCWPFPGHLFPLIALANQLRANGHECAFFTGARVAAVVEREGFQCFTFGQVDEAAVEELMRTRPAEPWRAANVSKLGRLLRSWLIDTLPDQVGDLERICAEWKPDVIGADPTFWAPVVVLYDKLRVQVAVCSFIPACTLPGAGVPPFGPGLPTRPGVLGATFANALRLTMRLTSRVSRRAVNDIRATHGLAPIDVAPSEYGGAMPLYLVPCSRSFDYAREDVPSSVHYVGPYLWNAPRTEAPATWIAELPRDRPCVHVTEGTVQVHRPFVLDAAIDGLGGLPLTVVASTGGGDRGVPRAAEAIPANFRIVSWAPHAELMPVTDVMVTTGGAGSVLASLAAGVPLVIVPTEWDKPEIAQRVVEAGAGIRLAPQQCTPSALRDAVLRVLKDESFKNNARRLAAEFAALGGTARAADLLVELSRAPRRAPASVLRTAAR